MGFGVPLWESGWCCLLSNSSFLTLSPNIFNFEVEFYHRVDSIIESSLREIIGSNNFALINFRMNFCETAIYDNKVFLENLVAVH